MTAAVDGVLGSLRTMCGPTVAPHTSPQVRGLSRTRPPSSPGPLADAQGHLLARAVGAEAGRSVAGSAWTDAHPGEDVGVEKRLAHPSVGGGSLEGEGRLHPRRDGLHAYLVDPLDPPEAAAPWGNQPDRPTMAGGERRVTGVGGQQQGARLTGREAPGVAGD